jgi:hypothetical protein
MPIRHNQQPPISRFPPPPMTRRSLPRFTVYLFFICSSSASRTSMCVPKNGDKRNWSTAAGKWVLEKGLFTHVSRIKMVRSEGSASGNMAMAGGERLSWKCRFFRCCPQLVLKTCLCVLLTRWPDTTDVSATSCDVGFFFLCRMSCRYLIANMSW